MSNEKEILIVTSKTKSYIKAKGYQSSGDAMEALNERIYEMIDKALERTKENKRSTVRPHDF